MRVEFNLGAFEAYQKWLGLNDGDMIKLSAAPLSYQVINLARIPGHKIRLETVSKMARVFDCDPKELLISVPETEEEIERMAQAEIDKANDAARIHKAALDIILAAIEKSGPEIAKAMSVAAKKEITRQTEQK